MFYVQVIKSVNAAVKLIQKHQHLQWMVVEVWIKKRVFETVCNAEANKR